MSELNEEEKKNCSKVSAKGAMHKNITCLREDLSSDSVTHPQALLCTSVA